MDSKIIFVRTNKGEDETRNKTAHLYGDIKRALLMVDGTATFGEISKRAAPSLRSMLDDMLKELEKGGFIQDKAKVGNVPKMIVPTKMSTPLKKPVDEGPSELDFTAAFRVPTPEMMAAEAAKARVEAEAKAKQESEVAKLRAQQEAEAARHKAEQEAARARAELEAAKAEAEAKARAEAEAKARQELETAKLKAQQEAEAARLKAEQEAAKAREEAERAKQQAAAEAKARAELEAARAIADAEAKAREETERRTREEAEAARRKALQEAEAARLKAEQEAAKAREEAERAKQQTVAETKAREEAEHRAKQEMDAARVKAEQEAAQAQVLAEAVKPKSGAEPTTRSTSATVLFFDVVGYTKLPVNKQIKIKKQFNQLVSDCLAAQGDGECIILDTGDGAAIGFLQHPEDAMEVAMQFRETVTANQHKDYPDLKVRIGIHLGPINVAKDMNGQSNMVGDGINDAQRVMSFAGIDQIYISRPYHDFVSRLSDEYAGLFQYRGSQKDKHGREHPVYELVDTIAPVAEVVLPQAGEPAPPIKLEPFSFAMSEAAASPVPVMLHEEPETQQDAAAQLIRDIRQFDRPEETKKIAVEQVTQQHLPPAVPPSSASAPETAPPKEAVKPVAEARMPSDEEVKKLAAAQAKAWAEAEQRAAQPHEAPHIAKEVPTARASRKPVPWGKVGAGLFVVLLIALFAVPYVLPTQDYATKIEQLLTARLQQPVHIGHIAGRLLPTPRLELSDVSVGEVKQIQVQQAQVNFALSALFASTKSINSLKLEGVQVNGTALQQVSSWLQQVAADTQYPVARIELSQGKLEADGILFSEVGGELSFNQAGKLAQAKLHADGNKFALDINTTPENKMQVAITVRGSALPLLPNWPFDELNAKGELTNDELVITDLDSRIRGGILLGDARIGWRSGWHAQGTLVAKTITMQNMSKLLGGDMDGKAHFQMQAASLAKLTNAAVMDGSFVIKKGIINGIDIVETARLRSRESLPGGRTHFDELSGDLSYANGSYHFRQMKMSAGVLNATGTLDIAKQQLSGKVSADLAMRAGMGTVALQVDGTTDSPSLRAAR